MLKQLLFCLCLLIISVFGDLYVFGKNEGGNLGITGGTSTNLTKVTTITKTIASIVGGKFHTFIRFTDNTISYTGNNAEGQICNNDTTTKLGSFTQLTHLTGFQVAGSSASFFFYNSSTSIYGCGLNTVSFKSKKKKLIFFFSQKAGQLSLGDQLNKHVLTQLSSSKFPASWKLISSSFSNSNFILDTANGTAFGTGVNTNGQLGIGNIVNQNLFTKVVIAENSTITNIVPGALHTFFILASGHVYAAGFDDSGRLGIFHGVTNKPTPVLIPFFNPTFVVAGVDHSFIVNGTGKLYAFGKGADGRLGTGSVTDQTTPKEISLGNINITQIYAGDKTSWIISSEEVFYGTGDNTVNRRIFFF